MKNQNQKPSSNTATEVSMGNQDYGSTTPEIDMMKPSPVSTDHSSLYNVEESHSPTARLLHHYHGDKMAKPSSLSEMVELNNASSRKDDNHSSEKYHGQVTSRNVRCRNWTIIIVSVVVVVGLVFNLFVTEDSDKKYGKKIVPSSVKPGQSNGARRFSVLDPVKDLGLYNYERPFTSPPPVLTKGVQGDDKKKNFPTNAWYQNLLMVDAEPGTAHRAYSIPYIVDMVGPIPGIRVHANHPGASTTVVQLNIIAEYGLTLGAGRDATMKSTNPTETHKYKASKTTPLGVTMDWDAFPMYSSITKGMPYVTMVYETIRGRKNSNGDVVLPTVAGEVPLAQNAIVDMKNTLACIPGETEPTEVQSEVELFFENSDFTWLVFVSEPVMVQCVVEETGGIRLQVVDWKNSPSVERDFVMRVALSKFCTSGRDPVYCHQEKMHPTSLLLGQGNYDAQLRKHAHLFPGPDSSFDYDVDDDGKMATLQFDWDVKDTRDIALNPMPRPNETETDRMLAYALPHHFDIITEAPPTDHNIYCVSTLIGPACLYEGSKWNLRQVIPDIDFRAPRPPAPWAIKELGKSLQDDLTFQLPEFFQKGIGDTYFSGKMLAKLGRILLVAEELTELCTSEDNVISPEYKDACNDVSLPSDASVENAIDHLRSSVEIWINGSAIVPFVFDSAWGGVVSCGCLFDGDTATCNNKFPDCAGFNDPGLNFGNAFYNDMHFHYGYHIYAAAIVAHFDPEWGRNLWERVLLLIRCIANPVEEDEYFPTWRNKDWYQGHSWASGIATAFPNGKNQESSSEAIAAYEAVALYGKVMTFAWENHSAEKRNIAKEVEKAGQILTASEVRSAKTYWHVKKDNKIKIYPSVYTQHSIGILWQMMAQFQTWFGNRPFLAIGIQLLPLTPISESRDGLSWPKELYSDFAESCVSDASCETYGWSVLQLAILATVGQPQYAVQRALALSPDVFESAGGNGHSLSNTIWYLASRPIPEEPLSIENEEDTAVDSEEELDSDDNLTPVHETPGQADHKPAPEVAYCGQPNKCTNYVLDTVAGLYTCRQRMNWLMQERNFTENQACYQIAVEENPHECGGCDPEADPDEELPPSRCSQCTPEQCESHLNRCPAYPKTFVCTEGSSEGGCTQVPWDVPSSQCTSCCELTSCPKPTFSEVKAQREAQCPPCNRDICRGSINRCPRSSSSQYLCIAGLSKAGCSVLPWAVDAVQCQKCCTLLPGCEF